MELNYFNLYLRNYLRDHSFPAEALESEIVISNAERAAQTYDDYRRNGASVAGATEVAINDLFIGIGLSRAETAADILEEEFSDRVNVHEKMVIDLWVKKLTDDNTIWESFYKEGELGLNEELVEEGKDKLRDRIDQFLIKHGIQQKTEITG